mmetsp:Transcript_4292/g.6425  ORF Transcript_4292/g.6425 Transcript_4292/m.6425 type:complete len:216 (+) Transcript_4292:2524-3171(+)
MSLQDLRHPSPSSRNSCVSNWPNSCTLSKLSGGEMSLPACCSTKLAALVMSVGCSFTSLDTKNVKKNGRPSDKCTVARPPTRTHLFSSSRRVTALMGLTGMTWRSSAVVSLDVSWPLFSRPGVSIIVTPFGSLIFRKSSVVPGRLDTVACGTVDRGFFLPSLPLLSPPPSWPDSSSRLMKEDLPTLAAPITNTLLPLSCAMATRLLMSFSMPYPD